MRTEQTLALHGECTLVLQFHIHVRAGLQDRTVEDRHRSHGVIDRIIDVFPSEQQHQIALQLSMVIKAVVSQQLVPAVDGTLVPAFEVMTVTPAIRNMIRENKVPQIEGVIYSSDTDEMVSMDSSLYKLVREGKITKDTAMEFAVNAEMLGRRLGV